MGISNKTEKLSVNSFCSREYIDSSDSNNMHLAGLFVTIKPNVHFRNFFWVGLRESLWVAECPLPRIWREGSAHVVRLAHCSNFSDNFRRPQRPLHKAFHSEAI